VALELGQCAEQMEHQPPLAGGGVNVFLQAAQSYLGSFEMFH
jgi:hypothetical protein